MSIVDLRQNTFLLLISTIFFKNNFKKILENAG